MDGKPTRRRVLVLSSSIIVAGLSGCVGNNGNGSDGEESDTDTSDGSETEREEDGSGDDTAGESDQSDIDESEDSESADGLDDGETVSEEELFQRIQMEDDYRFSFADEFGTATGRRSGGNLYTRSEESGSVAEFYRVDGTTYIVEDGECEKIDFDFPEDDRGDPDPEEVEYDVDRASVEYLGQDSIDGETVDVYKLAFPDDPGRAAEQMYILDSGHIRRIEYDSAVTDFFDWGSAAPVEPPDMECTAIQFAGMVRDNAPN